MKPISLDPCQQFIRFQITRKPSEKSRDLFKSLYKSKLEELSVQQLEILQGQTSCHHENPNSTPGAKKSKPTDTDNNKQPVAKQPEKIPASNKSKNISKQNDLDRKLNLVELQSVKDSKNNASARNSNSIFGGNVQNYNDQDNVHNLGHSTRHARRSQEESIVDMNYNMNFIGTQGGFYQGQDAANFNVPWANYHQGQNSNALLSEPSQQFMIDTCGNEPHSFNMAGDSYNNVNNGYSNNQNPFVPWNNAMHG